MAKRRLATGYTFDASAQTVVHADFSDIGLDGIQLIVNVTDQIIIYNFADTTKGGSLSTDTLTLEHDTTLMSDTDELMILVEDGLQQTVTAELSAVDNAVLDTIAAKDFATQTTLATLLTESDFDTKWEAGLVVDLGANNDVTVTSSALPTGASTAANQSTIIGHVDGIETLLGTIDADTSTLAATDFMLGTDFSAVFGVNTLLTTTQADARANTVDTFTVNSWGQYFNGTTWDRMRGDATDGLLVNLGSNNDVTVTGTVDLGATDNAVLDSIAALLGTIDTDTGNLTTIETNTDFGTVVGGGTEATALRVTIANNSTGVLSVDDNGGALTVDNGGTFAVQESGSALTALQLIDDVVYVDDADWTADTSKHALVGAVTQVTPTANTDGDTTPLITNALRELRIAPMETDLAAAGGSHVHKPFSYTGAQTDAIIWSPAAGKRFYITDYGFVVSAACTVTFEDDQSGGDVNLGMGGSFAANSGKESPGHMTPIFSGEDAADLLLTTSAGNIEGYVTGYEI